MSVDRGDNGETTTEIKAKRRNKRDFYFAPIAPIVRYLRVSLKKYGDKRSRAFREILKENHRDRREERRDSLVRVNADDPKSIKFGTRRSFPEENCSPGGSRGKDADEGENRWSLNLKN